jgi:glycosyltransferase involved in cell wall biosynthesis
VVVTSAGAGEYLVREHQIPASRVRVVPNAIDARLFSPDPGVPREPGLVVFVGRLAAEKNLASLEEAVAGVPGAWLRLVGDGPERAGLVERARRAGSRVELTGPVPNETLPRLLNQATAFALPSRYEGQPKALLEAMACALPVVGADVPGIRECVRHGETGWLCPPDAGGFREAIATVLADAALRERLGRAARADVERRHSVEAVAESELAIIRELVGA